MSRRRGLLVLVALMAQSMIVGCHDSKLNGTANGEPFGDVLSAIYVQKSDVLVEAVLMLTNYPGACITYNSYLNLGADPSEEPPLKALVARFQLLDPLEPKSYPVVGMSESYDDGIQWVHAWFESYTEEDGWEVGPLAGGGSLEIEILDETTMTGSLSIQLDGAEVLEGFFLAELCDAPI